MDIYTGQTGFKANSDIERSMDRETKINYAKLNTALTASKINRLQLIIKG